VVSIRETDEASVLRIFAIVVGGVVVLQRTLDDGRQANGRRSIRRRGQQLIGRSLSLLRWRGAEKELANECDPSLGQMNLSTVAVTRIGSGMSRDPSISRFIAANCFESDCRRRGPKWNL
jgi:hypothetical protein